MCVKELGKIKPRHWHEILRGILSLEKQYDKVAIEQSCGRALSYGATRYREIKRILEYKLYQQNLEGGSAAQELTILGCFD